MDRKLGVPDLAWLRTNGRNAVRVISRMNKQSKSSEDNSDCVQIVERRGKDEVLVKFLGGSAKTGLALAAALSMSVVIEVIRFERGRRKHKSLFDGKYIPPPVTWNDSEKED